MKNRKYDIHKAAGIIIVERKLLVTREKEMDFFVSPGGRLEAGETSQDALVRELYEEIGVVVDKSDLIEFGTFYAQASGNFNKTLRIDVFNVLTWKGQPRPCSVKEMIEEILWLDTRIASEVKVGSIFEHEVIPRLKKLDLID